MAITKIDGSSSVSTTEFSLTNLSTTLGAKTTVCIMQAFVDVSAMVAGDQYRFRVYEKVNGGSQAIVYEAVLSGAQATPVFVFPSLVVTDGWDVSAVRTAGADRTLKSSVRMVA